MGKPRAVNNTGKDSDFNEKGNTSQYETGTEGSDTEISDHEPHQTENYMVEIHHEMSDTEIETEPMILRSRSKTMTKRPSPRKPGSPPKRSAGTGRYRRQNEKENPTENLMQGDPGVYGYLKSAVQAMTSQVVAAIQAGFQGLTKSQQNESSRPTKSKSKPSKIDTVSKLKKQKQPVPIPSGYSSDSEQDNDSTGGESDSETDTASVSTSVVTQKTGMKSKIGFSIAKLPTYTGKEKWEVWINRFETVATLQNWDEKTKLSELLTRLQGEAGNFTFDQLSGKTLKNYAKLIKELKNRFGTFENKSTYKVQFNRRSQKQSESPAEYAAELKRIYDKAYSQRDAKIRQEDLLQRFLMGLSDHNARVHLELVKEPKTIEEAVQEVITYFETTSGTTGETNTNKFKKVRQIKKDDNKPKQNLYTHKKGPNRDQNSTTHNSDKGLLTLSKREIQEMFDKMYDDKRKSEVQQRQMTDDQNKRSNILNSTYKQNQQNYEKPNTEARNQGQKSVPICYFCGQPGHYARSCYSNPNRQTTTKTRGFENKDLPIPPRFNCPPDQSKPEATPLN